MDACENDWYECVLWITMNRKYYVNQKKQQNLYCKKTLLRKEYN